MLQKFFLRLSFSFVLISLIFLPGCFGRDDFNSDLDVSFSSADQDVKFPDNLRCPLRPRPDNLELNTLELNTVESDTAESGTLEPDSVEPDSL